MTTGLVHAAFAVDGSTTGLVAYLTVFALAAFVGIEVISKVPSILHTATNFGSSVANRTEGIPS